MHQVDMHRDPACSLDTGIRVCWAQTGHRHVRARPSTARACSMTVSRSRAVLTTCVFAVHALVFSPFSSTRDKVPEISEGRKV